MQKADVDKEIQALSKEDEIHPPDEEFDPSLIQAPVSSDPSINAALQGSAPGGIADDTFRIIRPSDMPGIKFPRKTQEEVVIDELLMSVPRAQGYYLKLHKEIAPNEFQLKQRIDNYEMWSDLEWEITKLVRDMTKKNPASWGTGKYRLVVWHDKGMRGQKRPPMDFWIDAEERPIDSGNGKAPSIDQQIDGYARLTEAIQKIAPPQQGISPNDVLKIATESMNAGQRLATDKEVAGNSAMAAMMTAMAQMMSESNKTTMTMLTLMMQNNKSQTDPITQILLTKLLDDKGVKSNPLNTIKELKDAGLIPKREEQGLSGELKNLTMLMEVARGLSGDGGDEGGGGVLNTLIKSLAPKVPEIVSNVTGTINKVVDFNKAKLQAMGAIPGKPSAPALNPPKEAAPETTEQSDEEKKEMLLKMFTNKLHKFVVNKEYDKFDEIAKTIRTFTGGAPIFEDAIKQGTMGAGDVKKFVTDYDKVHYQTEEEMVLLDEYCAEFVQFIKGQGDLIQVKCNKCGQEYNYDSQADFETDKAEGAKCEECGEGDLELVLAPAAA